MANVTPSIEDDLLKQSRLAASPQRRKTNHRVELYPTGRRQKTRSSLCFKTCVLMC